MTADDIMDGRLPEGPTVVFDADNYYLAGVIAERIRQSGAPVTYVTESDSVSEWAGKTSERWRVRTHLMEMGVKIVTAHAHASSPQFFCIIGTSAELKRVQSRSFQLKYTGETRSGFVCCRAPD